MARTDTLTHFLTDVADAIRAKTGSSSAIQASDFDTEIANITTGGDYLKNDVTFFDYDGTVLYSYNKNDFLALSALPENPSHEGLTAQGWNWTLADAQAYVTRWGKINIGQNYCTNDDTERIYINIDSDRVNKQVTVQFVEYNTGDATSANTVDWGDGSTPEAWSAYMYHTYTQEGHYVIKVNNSNGALCFNNGYSSFNTVTMSSPSLLPNITKIELSRKLKIKNTTGYMFASLTSLKAITIPSHLSFYGNYTFSNCYALECLVLPKECVSIGSRFCANCRRLKHVCMGKEITTIGSSDYGCVAFSNCVSLEELYLPDPTDVSNTDYHCGQICEYCGSLKEVIIPINTGDNEWQSSFYYCMALTDIKGYIKLCRNTFYYCYALQGKIKPVTATIYGNVFCYSPNVAYIDCSDYESVPTYGASSSYPIVYPTSSPTPRIIVPDALYDAWVSAWSSAVSYDRNRLVKASTVA